MFQLRTVRVVTFESRRPLLVSDHGAIELIEKTNPMAVAIGFLRLRTANFNASAVIFNFQPLWLWPAGQSCADKNKTAASALSWPSGEERAFLRNEPNLRGDGIDQIVCIQVVKELPVNSSNTLQRRGIGAYLESIFEAKIRTDLIFGSGGRVRYPRFETEGTYTNHRECGLRIASGGGWQTVVRGNKTLRALISGICEAKINPQRW